VSRTTRKSKINALYNNILEKKIKKKFKKVIIVDGGGEDSGIESISDDV